MNLRASLVFLLLLGTATAQDSAPISLLPGVKVPISRANSANPPDCITPPAATYAPDRDYPEKARRAHGRGRVVVELVVGTDGVPRDRRVRQGVSPDLDGAALDTVKHWKFTPASKDGKAVAVQLAVEVSFKLY